MYKIIKRCYLFENKIDSTLTVVYSIVSFENHGLKVPDTLLSQTQAKSQSDDQNI